MKRFKQRASDFTFDLDLAPMLSMMVTLIPILLLSVMFVRIVVIDTKVPHVVEKAIADDDKKKDRDLNLTLTISQSKALKLEILENGKRRVQRFNIVDGYYDLSGLHSALVKLKISNPDIFRIEFRPEESVTYDEIVKVMDEARQTKPGDPDLILRDKKTNIEVRHKMLFPNIVFGNVVEG